MLWRQFTKSQGIVKSDVIKSYSLEMTTSVFVYMCVVCPKMNHM